MTPSPSYQRQMKIQTFLDLICLPAKKIYVKKITNVSFVIFILNQWTINFLIIKLLHLLVAKASSIF